MPENVDCESSMSDFGTYACPKDAHYITTHYEDCTKFIECFDGSLKIKSCSGDLVFNPEKGICDYKYQTECQEPISLEHDTDVNYSSIKQQRQRPKRSDEILNQKYECEFNYIAPVENSCNQFIECENGYLFKKTCGPGTAYVIYYHYNTFDYDFGSHYLIYFRTLYSDNVIGHIMYVLQMQDIVQHIFNVMENGLFQRNVILEQHLIHSMGNVNQKTEWIVLGR